MAVGEYSNYAGEALSLAESWNGTAWSVKSTPNSREGTYGNRLEGISCVSSAYCVAVGADYPPVAKRQTFAEKWTTSAGWTLLAPISPAEGGNLTGVSCTSETSCIAIGYQFDKEETVLALAEHWNNTAWSSQTMPNAKGAEYTEPSGISCPTAKACLASGAAYISGKWTTLAEAEL
jgi:hypothetical protein